MKKFLSILLALAVGFTFTFGSAMSAFAADKEYTLDDYNAVFQAEKTAQTSYMKSAKEQAVNSYTYDKDGFYNDYMKAAYEAAADAVIEDALSAADKAINAALNGTFPTTVAPAKSVVTDCTEQYTTKDGMSTALQAKTDVLDKTQAPLSKAFVEGKLVVDTSKYNATTKAYNFVKNEVVEGDVLTAAETVELVLATAKDMVAKADKASTDAAKISGYYEAATYFETQLAKVMTAEDEAIVDGEVAKEVASAAKAFVAKAQKALYPVFDVVDGTFPTAADTTKYAEFYVAKTAKAKATLFGVEIADINNVTKAEAMAVNTAAYNAINASEAVLVGSGMTAGQINALTDYAGTVAKTMTVADKYAEVKALGEELKGEYVLGMKTYNDAKVDAAVKDAEALVYADLGAKDAEYYLNKAANGLDNLKEVNFEIDKFKATVEAAIAKMYNKNGGVAVSVKYGDNKTPEADYVYLQEMYADKAAWGKIAHDTVEALEAAESYAEIDEIMANAAKEFGKLMLAADAADVAKAQDTYEDALEIYATAQWTLADKTKYSEGTYEFVLSKGLELIDEAVTVDGVKAAYEEAKALFNNVKSNDELKAMKEDAEKKIAALPYDSKLTVADKDAVMAAYNAVKAYYEAGGTDNISTAVLKAKMNKINELVAEEINKAATELNKKFEAASTNSDADVAARVALKAEADALVEKAEALEDEIKAINDESGLSLAVPQYNAAYKDIEDAVNDYDLYYDEINNAARLLVKASKEGATAEEMQAALDAYNNLTERQQLYIGEYLDGYTTLIKNIEAKLAVTDDDVKAYLNTLKVTVKSSKTTKGNVKVTGTVTVKATGEAADFTKFTDAGYTVKYKFYRSTKPGINYSVRNAKDTTTWTNNSGKKGTKYYYKMKVFVYDKDGNFVGQTYQSQCNYTSKVFGK